MDTRRKPLTGAKDGRRIQLGDLECSAETRQRHATRRLRRRPHAGHAFSPKAGEPSSSPVRNTDEGKAPPRRGNGGTTIMAISRTLGPEQRPARGASVPFRQPGTHPSARTVVDCYEFFDRLFPACGLEDYTEGIYGAKADVSYEQAQRNQHNWLLDQAGCGPGSRLLDIGCGSGSLLVRAEQRGARAVGITISPRQVARCRARGLDAHLLNYRNLNEHRFGRFDAIIANGSAEHFVQPRDAIEGRAGALYAELFALCHRLLDPHSPSRRFVTTVIHFGRVIPDPRELMRGPLDYPWGSDRFHAALLERTMGGFYPVPGQLARCARRWFDLVGEVDGTEDYRRTSEEWLDRVRTRLLSRRGSLALWRDLVPFVLRHPRQGLLSLLLLHTQSWQWQFRGENPPTRLLRQTWQAC